MKHSRRIITDEELEAVYRMEGVITPQIEALRDAWLGGAEVQSSRFYIDPTMATGRLVLSRTEPDLDRDAIVRALLSSYTRMSAALNRAADGDENGAHLVQVESRRMRASAWKLWDAHHRVLLRGSDFSGLPRATREWLALCSSAYLFWVATHALRFGFNRVAERLATFGAERVLAASLHGVQG